MDPSSDEASEVSPFRPGGGHVTMGRLLQSLQRTLRESLSAFEVGWLRRTGRGGLRVAVSTC